MYDPHISTILAKKQYCDKVSLKLLPPKLVKKYCNDKDVIYKKWGILMRGPLNGEPVVAVPYRYYENGKWHTNFEQIRHPNQPQTLAQWAYEMARHV